MGFKHSFKSYHYSLVQLTAELELLHLHIAAECCRLGETQDLQNPKQSTWIHCSTAQTQAVSLLSVSDFKSSKLASDHGVIQTQKLTVITANTGIFLVKGNIRLRPRREVMNSHVKLRSMDNYTAAPFNPKNLSSWSTRLLTRQTTY